MRNKKLGLKHSKETRKKMSILHLKNPTRYWLGKKRSELEKEKLSKLARKRNKEDKNFGFKKGQVSSYGFLGRKHTEEWKIYMKKNNNAKKGNKHYNWNPDREAVKRNKRDNTNAEYHLWARNVKRRDNWKCKIANKDCEGRLEAHHILPWSQYVELRYEINNGITLCQFHHPKKREDEKMLAPMFQNIVNAIAN